MPAIEHVVYHHRGVFPVAEHESAQVLGVWISGQLEYRVQSLPFNPQTDRSFITQNYGEAMLDFDRRIRS